MKIVLGLGNPGRDYANTRHNVGQRYLLAYAAGQHVNFVEKPKFKAEIAEFSHVSGEKVLLVMSSLYYNEVGETARSILDFYKCTAADFLIIHDELALPLGTVRTREQGSHAGNNGIKSLISHIGSDFSRIRIGIKTDLADQMDAADFVLAYFSAAEYKILDDHIEPVVDAVDDFINGTFAATTHRQ